MPRFVLSDLPKPRVCVVMIAVSAGWLIGRALLTGFGGELGALDVMAVMAGAFVPVVAALGPRTIVIDESGIRVTRRGRVLARRLDEVAEIRAMGPLSRLVFTDGAWLLWSITGPDWGPATDFLTARITPREQAGWLRLPADRIHFPPRCLGCGAAPELEPTITARRGLDLLLWSMFIARHISVPACARCDNRRLQFREGCKWGPLGLIVGCFFLPYFTPLRGTPVGVLVVALLLVWLVLRNRGEAWGDASVWGVRARLMVDGTISLRCRDPALQAAVAGASRTHARAAVTPANIEV